jgi:hypothetical protein
MTREDFRRLQRGFLMGGTLEIESEMNLATPIVSELVHFKTNGEEIRRLIQNQVAQEVHPEELSSKRLKAILKSVVTTTASSFGTSVESLETLFGPFQEELFQNFFTQKNPVDCEENRSDPEAPCFQLKAHPMVKPVYEFSHQREEYVGNPVTIRSRSKLTDAFSKKDLLSIR